MLKIDVIHLSGGSNYPVNYSTLITKLKNFLSKRKIKDADLVVVITDEEEMIRLGKKYLKETRGTAHNVLSFPNSEIKGEFIYPPKEKNKLGEVIVCYPLALEEANEEGKNIDDKIYELASHGVLHLLGIHHN